MRVSIFYNFTSVPKKPGLTFYFALKCSRHLKEIYKNLWKADVLVRASLIYWDPCISVTLTRARTTAESPKKLGMLLARPQENSAIKPKYPRLASPRAILKKKLYIQFWGHSVALVVMNPVQKQMSPSSDIGRKTETFFGNTVMASK